MKRRNFRKMNPESPPLPSAPRRVLAFSTFAFTLLFAVWLMLGVLSVPIKKELGLSGIQFTWLTSVAVLSGAILRMPFGVLADIWGGRRTMVLLLLGTAVPCFVMSRVETFEGAIACALLFGLAGNAFSAGIAWNAAWFRREHQGAALGTFGAGNVGASVTKLFGPQLIALVPAAGWFHGFIPGGWRAIPVVYALSLVLTAIALLVGCPPDRERSVQKRPLHAMLRPLAELRVWRFGLYYVVVFGAYVALSLWLPTYYAQVYGLTLPQAALLTAFFIFPASLLRPLGGYLADRYGGRAVTYAVFVASLGASGVLCLPPRVLPVTAFFFTTLALGICMGIGKASVYKFIPEHYPNDVGLVGGLVGTIGALGGFVLPLGFGYLEAALGRPAGCFYVLTATTGVSLFWLHSAVRSKALKPNQAAELQTA